MEEKFLLTSYSIVNGLETIDPIMIHEFPQNVPLLYIVVHYVMNLVSFLVVDINLVAYLCFRKQSAVKASGVWVNMLILS